MQTEINLAAAINRLSPKLMAHVLDHLEAGPLGQVAQYVDDLAEILPLLNSDRAARILTELAYVDPLKAGYVMRDMHQDDWLNIEFNLQRGLVREMSAALEQEFDCY